MVKWYERETCYCDYCDNTIHIYPSEFKYHKKHYCDRICYSKSMRSNKLAKGNKLSDETKKKMSLFRLGKRNTLEQNQKVRLANLGSKSHFWKGGRSTLRQRLIGSNRYLNWRTSVFEHDGYICQKKNCEYCNNRKSCYIEAHHIIPFAECLDLDYIDMIYNIDNGITYCREYHKNINGGK